MDDEPIDWKSIGLPLNLLGIAACAVAIFSSGGLAFLGGAVAVACLAGSVISAQVSNESPCERDRSEPDGMDAPGHDAETGVEPEVGHSRHWRQKVEAGRGHCRKR